MFFVVSDSYTSLFLPSHAFKTSTVNEEKYQKNDATTQPQGTSVSPGAPDKHRSTTLTSNKISHQSPLAMRSTSMEYKENGGEKENDRSHPSQRVPSDPPSSQCRLEENRDHSHIAYVPDLPYNGHTNEELESNIRRSLEIKNRLHIIDVKCNSQFGLGIVYLQNREDRDHLVNTIKRIFLEPDSDLSVSFVSEFDLVSYIVLNVKYIKASPHSEEIKQQWTRLHPTHHLSKCKQLCSEFPNIFQIVASTVEEWIKSAPLTDFIIGGQTAFIYFRADCCFFDALPQNTTEDTVHSAIRDQLSSTKLSRENLYIQLNEAEGEAVVLVCNETRRWKSYNSLTLHGQTLMKKDRLTHSLRLRSVPSDISVSSIEQCQMFSGSVLQAIRDSSDLIVEAKSVSSPKKDGEINASNWYETEMMAGKSSIVEFICQPDHRIFRLKWNAQAFLEQFHRCSSQDQSSVNNGRDYRRTISVHKRHLLRMTVMLNTIGIVKRGKYSFRDKKIQLTSNSLKTILYNHQSTLQHQMILSSSQGIEYPYQSTSVHVLNKDCLIVYEYMISKGYHPLLLNMANATSPGGGYRQGDGAQEENLFRRSDYYRSLDLELDQDKSTSRSYCSPSGDLVPLPDDQSMYPMDEFGAIYTSGLTVFRRPENKGYELRETPMVDVCALAMPAYRNPTLTDQNLLNLKYSIGTRKKIETIFAIAKHHHHDCLVLSAFGCGAYRNPPKHMATIFKSVIEQYAGFFRKIYFAIIDDHNTGQHLNPRGNYEPFYEILDGLEAQPVKQTTVDTMIGPWRILNETVGKEITLSEVRICSLLPCYSGGHCRDIENQRHCREYLHPPLCPLTGSPKICDDDNHMLWFRHQAKRSNDPDTGRKDYRGRDYLKQYNNASEDDDVNEKRGANHYPICPWTPFHCRQHSLLVEATNIQGLPGDVQDHCHEFRHICRFGGQCEETSTFHWEMTIHIARKQCSEGKHCSQINREDHLNSFSHPGIADIRRLCHFSGSECRDRQQLEHLVRYRHQGNNDCSSVIPYYGLNSQINFIQNQQDIISTIHQSAERLKLKTPLSIPRPVLKCIQGLSPIYQCSKVIFEMILAQGHVMSNKRLAQLTNVQNLVRTIEHSRHIQPIIIQWKPQRIDGHINRYIQAIVLAEHSRRAGRSSSYLSTTTSNEKFNDVIRDEEKFLRNILTHEQVNTIRQSTIHITEASMNLPTNSSGVAETSEKYITTVFGPRLRPREGEIVLIFKREVMFHPDANFSIQINGRSKQIPQSSLHCSGWDYDYAAAAALITTVSLTKKTADIDLKAILKHMSSVQSDELFESHLPEMIPLDYIEEVYIPQTVFYSLTSSAQVSAKNLLHASLHIIPYEGNRDHQRVNDQLMEKLTTYIERPQQSLRGTTITLPSSHLTECVTLPFTIVQLYDQYCRNHRVGSLSNDVYIYWQSMYGDMMMVLSKEPIDFNQSTQNSQSLICYIAETPSPTTSDYHELYTYLNVGHPSQHTTTIDRRSFLASSNTFHRGCDADDYLTYCLKLERSTGEVILSHAGPNSVYNYQMISHRFTESYLGLKELKYIQITAGSQRVPTRNLMVCFRPLFELHPSSEKILRRTDIAFKQTSAHSSGAPKQEKSPDIISRVTNAVCSLVGYDRQQKALIPCRDSVNCLQQTSEDHCKKYSHPCRFSELCQRQYNEPYFTHEPHRVEMCVSDKSCRRLDNPSHRATFRHTGRPDFLIPCRNQTACRDRSFEHRIKYSHGEKIHLKSATTEYYSKDQQKISSDAIQDKRTACRHGSKCRDQNERQHCAKYSHPSDQNHLRGSHRESSASYQANDAIHESASRRSDPSRHQSPGFDQNQRKPCPFGTGCVYYDAHHRSKYLH